MVKLSSLASRSGRRLLYPLISVVVALGLWLGQPIVAQAIPWFDIILQGIQVVQLSSMSDKQEVALGQQINTEVSKQVKINSDPRLNQYVNQIGQRLAAESGRTKIPYTFQVVTDSNINAFATMGGFVYINTGLMKAADNEAQLASVIGHETGHIVGKHAVKQMKEAAIAQGIAGAAGLDRNVAVAIGVELALKRPKSRQHEFEADKLGLGMLGKAGYGQSAMPAFMSKLLKSGGSVPTILSTHPATSDRITRMNQMIDPAKANVGDGLNNAEYQAKVKSLLP